jgi:hypothetical protein
LSLCAEHSFFFSLIQTRGYTLTLETPYLIRWNYLFVGCMANALTGMYLLCGSSDTSHPISMALPAVMVVHEISQLHSYMSCLDACIVPDW